MDALTGLSQTVAEQRLQSYGPNRLPEPERPSLLKIFTRQFKSSFIYVLLVASIVSLGLGEIINCIFILVVLLLNATIGTAQEFAAERAASGLKKMVPHHATVLRDGKPIEIDSVDIVPGDIVLLVSGDKVAADLKLIHSMELEIDESMLTGESLSVKKDAYFSGDDEMPSADRLDLAYAGTVVLRGRGRGQVIATGLNTEIGKIASDVSSDEDAKPPLLQRIHKFTMRITWAMMMVGIHNLFFYK